MLGVNGQLIVSGQFSVMLRNRKYAYVEVISISGQSIIMYGSDILENYHKFNLLTHVTQWLKIREEMKIERVKRRIKPITEGSFYPQTKCLKISKIVV